MYETVVKVVTAGCLCVCSLVTSDAPKHRSGVHRAHHAKPGVKRRHAVRHHRVHKRVKKVCTCGIPQDGAFITPEPLAFEPIAPFPAISTVQPLIPEVVQHESFVSRSYDTPVSFIDGGGYIGGGSGGSTGGGGGGSTDIPPIVTPPVITPPVLPPVAPVPEPATWLMMLLGFGLIGYTIRSRKVSFKLA